MSFAQMPDSEFDSLQSARSPSKCGASGGRMGVRWMAPTLRKRCRTFFRTQRTALTSSSRHLTWSPQTGESEHEGDRDKMRTSFERARLVTVGGLLLAGTVLVADAPHTRFSDFTPLASSAGPTIDESHPITFGNPEFDQESITCGRGRLTRSGKAGPEPPRPGSIPLSGRHGER